MRLLFYIATFFTALPLLAQESSMLWQHSFGGSGDDKFSCSATDESGNIILVGSIQNTSGSLTHNDVYIIKMTAGGLPIWVKQVGGSGDDQGNSVIVTTQGNIAIAGSTTSSDGAFISSNGLQDIFVLILDPNGDLIKTSTYGGSSIDYGMHIALLPTGNLLLSGSSRSKDWPGIANEGQFDVVILELTSDLNLVNQFSYGGTDDEMVVKSVPLDNGEFLTLASSTSYIDAFSDNKGDQDIVLFKFDMTGNVLWQHSYGGFLSDRPEDVLRLNDGGFLVAGSTFSSDYDISDNNGGSDGWLYQVDESGVLLWESTFGGAQNDEINAVAIAANGDIMVLGTTVRPSTTSQYNADFWLFRFDGTSYSMVDQHYFGASGFEQASSLLLSSDGMIIMSGNRSGEDSQTYGATGQNDGWVLAVRSEASADLITAHPNPTNGVIYLNNCPESTEITIYSITGEKQNLAIDYFPGARMIDLSLLSNGVYLVNTHTNGSTQTIRVVKN